MKTRRTLPVLIFSALLLGPNATLAQQCSDREYATFKKYDAFLDANPAISDDQARSTFAARVGMRPAALKALYFRCVLRWKDQEPESARRTAQEVVQSMVADGETPLTKGHSCTKLGYRYGHTATSTMLGREAKLGWDFVMPDRCKNLTTTEVGIKAGAKAAAG